MTDYLLDLDDIAGMWKCTRRHARDVVVKQPDFPQPAPGSTLKFQTWVAGEVRAFVNRKRARIPHDARQAA